MFCDYITPNPVLGCTQEDLSLFTFMDCNFFSSARELSMVSFRCFKMKPSHFNLSFFSERIASCNFFFFTLRHQKKIGRSSRRTPVGACSTGVPGPHRSWWLPTALLSFLPQIENRLSFSTFSSGLDQLTNGMILTKWPLKHVQVLASKRKKSVLNMSLLDPHLAQSK